MNWKENWDYYLGNHFQFWNGASIDRESGASPEIRRAYYKELERIFHSYNVVGRIVSHYVNALVGKPYTVSLKYRDGSSKEVPEEAKQLINNWRAWQTKTHIKKGGNRGSAIAEALTQMLATKHGYLRLYQPERFVNLEPYKRIVLHAPSLSSIEIERDDDEILYRAKYHTANGTEEIYELLNSGLTRIATKAGTTDYDYGGFLPIFQIGGRCLINSDLKQIQQAINTLLTMWNKNLEFAGFPERVILNGQAPGEWIKDDQGRDIFVSSPEKFRMGADRINFINPIPIGDRRNPAGYTRAEMFYRDPVDVETFDRSLAAYKTNAYEVSGLAHLLSAGDGRISGKSRISIKEDYVSDLSNYEKIVEDVLEEVYELVLLFLDRDYPQLNLKEIQPVIDLNVSIAAPPEEREQNRADYQAGLLSAESVIAANGRDAFNEINLIDKDQKRKLELLKTDEFES
jgi:hypothetical protein